MNFHKESSLEKDFRIQLKKNGFFCLPKIEVSGAAFPDILCIETLSGMLRAYEIKIEKFVKTGHYIPITSVFTKQMIFLKTLSQHNCQVGLVTQINYPQVQLDICSRFKGSAEKLFDIYYDKIFY